MQRLPTTRALLGALKAEGFPVPDECADIEILLPAHGVFQMRFLVFLTGERLAQFGRALEVCGIAAQAPQAPVRSATSPSIDVVVGSPEYRAMLGKP